MDRWLFAGVAYATRSEMCRARRERHVEHLGMGVNFTRAARAVGVSKRTGKVWRNGGTRLDGRNERPPVDWYRSTMDTPRTISSRYFSQDERTSIADWKRAGPGIRRNTNPVTGGHEPYRAQQMSAGRLKRPKRARIHAVPGLLDRIGTGLESHWSPERIAGRLRADSPDNKSMHVCTETIYQAIYIQAGGGLKREAAQALRSGRTRRNRAGTPIRGARVFIIVLFCAWSSPDLGMVIA